MTTIDERIEAWRDQLVDLTARNPQLSMRTGTRSSTIARVLAPEMSVLFSELIANTSLLVVGVEQPPAPGVGGSTPPPDFSGNDQAAEPVDMTDEPAPPIQREAGQLVIEMPLQDVQGWLRKIKARADAAETEQGVVTCFVGIGALRWVEGKSGGKDGARVSPLVMVPVELQVAQSANSFRVVPIDQDPEFNGTLVRKLRTEYGIELPDAVELPAEEGADPVTAYLDLASHRQLGEGDDRQFLANMMAAVRQQLAAQPDWVVEDSAWLGLFPWQKLRMSQDLEEYPELVRAHPVLSQLVPGGGLPGRLPATVPTEENLDLSVHPTETWSILRADSSQHAAIRAAVAGESFILDGPPGTGKSQTIANVIAELLARGKRVLFVSEKAAAMQVVHDRLAEQHLAGSVLMVASGRGSRTGVVRDINRQYEKLGKGGRLREDPVALSQVASLRQELDRYPELLHTPLPPSGKSPYEIIGAYLQLGEAPLLRTTFATEDLTAEKVEARARLIGTIAEHEAAVRTDEQRPWMGLVPEQMGLRDREQLRDALVATVRGAESLDRRATTIATLLEYPLPDSLEGVRRLVGLTLALPTDGSPRAAWFEAGGPQRGIALLEEAMHRAIAANEAELDLLTVYRPSFFALASTDHLEDLGKRWPWRFPRRAARDLSAAIAAEQLTPEERSIPQQQADLQRACDVLGHRVWLDQHAADIETWAPKSPDIVNPDAILYWERRVALLQEIAPFIRSGGLATRPAFLAAVLSGSRVESLREIALAAHGEMDGLEQALAALETLFTAEARQVDDAPLTEAPLPDVAAWAKARIAGFTTLGAWLAARAGEREAQRIGLGEVLLLLTAGDTPPDRWEAAYRKTVLTALLDEIWRNDAVLANFSGLAHEHLREVFRDNDLAALDDAPDRVRNALSSAAGMGADIPRDELEALQDALIRRSAPLPLRRLFAQIPTLLLTVKPCIMMSPLGVAHHLPAATYHDFDVVVFDEASQILPEDAIGAIMRGRQLVVAGDPMQLPPTTFFMGGDDDEETLDGVAAAESILDALAAKGLPKVRLLYHYRSRHEQLIAFSNHRFYEGTLVTFPSADSQATPERGVHLEYVQDGRWLPKKGTGTKRENLKEAERVVNLVMDHAGKDPKKTLGVVAFGQNQRDAIATVLRERTAGVPDKAGFFGDSGTGKFFIKSLEEVQGDERDVMIVSVGYGKGDDGTFLHNFGPLNQAGGERRLNVLVTRAKEKLILVTSVKSVEIDGERLAPGALGARALKDYIAYAETSSHQGDHDMESERIPPEKRDEASRPTAFEQVVAQAVRSIEARPGEPFEVRTRVGTSSFRIDIAVLDPVDPTRYALGICCDGPVYASSHVARDREWLREEVLRGPVRTARDGETGESGDEKADDSGLGWTIYRVWAPDWVRNPEFELSRLREALFEATGFPHTVHPEDTIPEKGADDTAPDLTPRAASPLMLVPYRKAVLAPAPEDLALAAFPIGEGWLPESIMHVIDLEGPVHIVELLERLSEAAGVTRMSTKDRLQVGRAIELLVAKGEAVEAGEYLALAAYSELEPRGPTDDGWARPITHISDAELWAGMEFLLKMSGSLEPGAFIDETARLFGYPHAGKVVQAHLNPIFREAISQGNAAIREIGVEAVTV